MNRIDEISKQYGMLRDLGKELGDKPSLVIEDMDYLIGCLDKCKAALEKNKSEWEIIAKQNDTYKALVAWQLTRDTLKEVFGE